MKLELIWVIYKSGSNDAKREALDCIYNLESLGVKALIIEGSLKSNHLTDLLKKNINLPNLAVVLGGDGTVLNAARNLAIHNIPIISFNVGGNLGFLTHDHQLLKSNNLWDEISKDNFSIKNRMMLEGSVQVCSTVRNAIQKDIFFWALNDIYFRSSPDELCPTCTLELRIDGESVDIYRGDGVIISSPTGSTAYSLATGGPILHPSIEAMIVSPICPISLASRPIVVPAESQLIIKPLEGKNQRVQIWKDGISNSRINLGEQCVIQKAKHFAQMLILKQRDSYYRTLSQKLHWAGSLMKKSIKQP